MILRSSRPRRTEVAMLTLGPSCSRARKVKAPFRCLPPALELCSAEAAAERCRRPRHFGGPSRRWQDWPTKTLDIKARVYQTARQNNTTTHQPISPQFRTNERLPSRAAQDLFLGLQEERTHSREALWFGLRVTHACHGECNTTTPIS